MDTTRDPRGMRTAGLRSGISGLCLMMGGLVVLQMGCFEEGTNRRGWWGEQFSSAGQGAADPVSSEANAGHEKDALSVGASDTTVRTPNAGPSPVVDEPADPNAYRLQQQVEQYVSRFPENAGGHAGDDGRAAAPPAQEQAPPTLTARNDSTAKPGSRSQRQPAGMAAPAPQNSATTEQAASPLAPSGPPGASGASVQPTDGRTQLPEPSNRAQGQWQNTAGWRQPRGPETGGDAVRPNTGVSTTITGQPEDIPPRQSTPSPSSWGIELIDVRPAKAKTDDQASGNRDPLAANQPVSRAEAAASGIGAYLRQLEQRVAQHPNQFDDLYKLRLLYAATGQRSKAMAPPENLDEAHSELLRAFLDVISVGDQVLTQPSASATEALTAVEELSRLLRQQTPVIIPRIAMVTRVNSFGDYTAVDPPVFEKGKPVHVYVYTEIANFRSEPTADGRLRTVLSESVEVFDSSGKIVWEKSVPEFEDRTITPRRDFFYPFEIKLPADLPAGQYALKVTVEDKLSATTDQQRMTFSIQ